MTTSDVHTLTGAYVVDALDPADRELFETHLRGCAECRQEVAELAATATRLGAGAAVSPPPGLRERVLAEAARTRQLPPLLSAHRAARPNRARWWREPVTVAAALLLVVSSGLGALAWTEHRRAGQAEARVERVAALATDPDRVERAGAALGGGRGTLVTADGAAVFRAAGLPELPADRAYQLWLISRDSATSAGVLGRSGSLQALVDDTGGATALGLTVEPRGGSEEPTGELVLRLSLPS